MDNNSLIVSNGAKKREVIEVELVKFQSHFLEEFDLTGIEVIDLKVNTIAEIAERITEDKTAKILAIEARNRAEILSAIAAGASGVLSEKISLEDAALAIQSFKQEGCVLVDSKEADFLDFLIVPRSSIETKLEQLQKELASTSIQCWRKKPLPKDLEIDSIVGKLATSNLVTNIALGIEKLSVERELELLSEQWQDKKCSNPGVTDLVSIATKIQERYFSQKIDRTSYTFNNNLATIRLNAYKQKNVLLDELADLFTLCIKFGSIAVEKFLESIISKLQKHENYYENEHQKVREEIIQYWLSYQTLVNLVAKSGTQHDFESALRALKLIQEATIRSEIYRAISCIIFELICELSFYRERTFLTNKFLDELAEELGEQSKKPLETNDNLQTQFFLLRNELESRLGSLFNWYDFPDIKKFVSSKILEECRILALELILEKY